jgi:hypothetical protein
LTWGISSDLTADEFAQERGLLYSFEGALQYRVGVYECQVGGRRMEGLGNIGLMEILVIAGVCGVCALPVVVGAIVGVVVVLGRNKQNPS